MTVRRSSRKSRAVMMPAGSLTTLCDPAVETTMTLMFRVSGAKLKPAAVSLKSPSASTPDARCAARSTRISVAANKEVTQHDVQSTNALTHSRARYTGPQRPLRRSAITSSSANAIAGDVRHWTKLATTKSELDFRGDMSASHAQKVTPGGVTPRCSV